MSGGLETFSQQSLAVDLRGRGFCELAPACPPPLPPCHSRQTVGKRAGLASPWFLPRVPGEPCAWAFPSVPVGCSLILWQQPGESGAGISSTLFPPFTCCPHSPQLPITPCSPARGEPLPPVLPALRSQPLTPSDLEPPDQKGIFFSFLASTACLDFSSVHFTDAALNTLYVLNIPAERASGPATEELEV